jgi:single-strand DNA-binding protein
MKCLNKVLLVGYVADDPKHFPTQGGGLCSFTVCTSVLYTDKNGEKGESAEFHKIVAFGKTSDLAYKILSKGRKVLVEGYIRSSTFEDKEGVKRRKVEIISYSFIALDSKKENDVVSENVIDEIDGNSLDSNAPLYDNSSWENLW